MKIDRCFEVGNLAPPRKGFESPQEGRVYLRSGLSPTIRVDTQGRYWICYEEDGTEEDARL